MGTERMAELRGFGTRCIHAGEAPDPTTGAHGVPLYQNVTYAFETHGQVEAMRCGERPHFTYSPRANPTVRCLELKLADLEGTETAIALNSGMAAISGTLLTLLSGGGRHRLGSPVRSTRSFWRPISRRSDQRLPSSTSPIRLALKTRLFHGHAPSTPNHFRTPTCGSWPVDARRDCPPAWSRRDRGQHVSFAGAIPAGGFGRGHRAPQRHQILVWQWSGAGRGRCRASESYGADQDQ